MSKTVNVSSSQLLAVRSVTQQNPQESESKLNISPSPQNSSINVTNRCQKDEEKQRNH